MRGNRKCRREEVRKSGKVREGRRLKDLRDSWKCRREEVRKKPERAENPGKAAGQARKPHRHRAERRLKPARAKDPEAVMRECLQIQNGIYKK